MFHAYVTEKECICPTSLKKADCECFTLYERRVPNRISKAQLVHARLWFINNNAEARNLKTNMRLREARLFLKQSDDLVVLRYEKLWHKMSAQFAVDADEEIIRLANMLELEVVSIEPTLTQQTRRLMVDDDDEEDEMEPAGYRFDARDSIDEGESVSQSSRPYNVQQNSVKRQLNNYISQTDSHFQVGINTVFFLSKQTFKTFKHDNLRFSLKTTTY